MAKRPLYILTLLLASGIGISNAAPPSAPRGVCIQTSEGLECSPEATQNSGSNTGAIKWHPGHYVGLSAGTTKPGQTFTMSGAMKNSVFIGIKMKTDWTNLEPSKGVYDFSTVENVLAEAQKYGKGLILEVRERSFKSCSSGLPVPSYLLTTEYNGGVAGDSDSCTAQVWNQNVIDRLIALYQALASRFDEEPYFYGVRTEESALNLSTADKISFGWTDSSYHQQMLRFNSAVKQTFKYTPYFIGYNFGSHAQDILEHALQNGYGVAWPDTVPGKPADIQDYVSSYRGKIPVWAETQSPAAIDYAVQDVYDYGVNKYGATHMVWKEADYSLTAPASYLTDYVIPFLLGNHPTVTTCPSNLSEKCDASN